jgi:hypothetical protein
VRNLLVGSEDGALYLELLILLENIELADQHYEIKDETEYDENGG